MKYVSQSRKFLFQNISHSMITFLSLALQPAPDLLCISWESCTFQQEVCQRIKLGCLGLEVQERANHLKHKTIKWDLNLMLKNMILLRYLRYYDCSPTPKIQDPVQIVVKITVYQEFRFRGINDTWSLLVRCVMNR